MHAVLGARTKPLANLAQVLLLPAAQIVAGIRRGRRGVGAKKRGAPAMSEGCCHVQHGRASTDRSGSEVGPVCRVGTKNYQVSSSRSTTSSPSMEPPPTWNLCILL